MGVFDRARSLVISKTNTSSGAGNYTIQLRPDEVQTVWELLGAWGWHTAGGARNAVWYFHDPETDVPLHPSLSLAANTDFSVYGCPAAAYRCLVVRPVIVTYTHFPTLVITASAAGENMYVRALVREVRGVDCDGD